MLLHATTGNNSEAVTARTIGISDLLSCHLTQDIPPLHALPTASSIDFSLPWKAHPDAPSSLAMPGSSSHAPCRAASEMNPHTAWARLWTSAGQRTQRLGAKGFSDRADFLGRLKRLARNNGRARPVKRFEVDCHWHLPRHCQKQTGRRAYARRPAICRALTGPLS